MKAAKTVFVGLSGGVDSAVAALRLQKQGYKVVGVFIKVWHPEFLRCNWEEERLDAMRVAAHLGIPFLTCDAVDAYKQGVADYFIAEYLAGRTPNPDVMCNQAVKFGVFLDFALERGADYIATGHYAQKIDNCLCRGVDKTKDQTYFLWTLPTEKMDRILFPIGDSVKEKIRREAAKAGIPTASKKDSQGICFLGHVDIPDFISHYTKLMPGNVLDERGYVIGVHKGALVYTLGQRHGFNITAKSTKRSEMYVVERDLTKNTITVSNAPPLTKAHEKISLKRTVLRAAIDDGVAYHAQFRYRQEPVAVDLEVHKDDILVTTKEKSLRAAIGQSCVIYRGVECIGGGIISS